MVRFVTKAKTVADNEMKRRRGVEKRSVQAKEMADVRARQTATAAKNKLEKDEKNRKDALNALDGKQKRKTSGTNESEHRERKASIANECSTHFYYSFLFQLVIFVIVLFFSI